MSRRRHPSVTRTFLRLVDVARPSDRIEASASQFSRIVEEGEDVRFEFSGGSSASPTSSAFFSSFRIGSSFEFLIEFSIDEATGYELTGEGTSLFDGPRFTFVDNSGERVRSLSEFEVAFDGSARDQELVYDFAATEDFDGSILDNTGVLEAGSYTFGVRGETIDEKPGAGRINLEGFGLILRDSSLAGSGDNGDGGPVPIPSPAALPAGLALLGAGLMRRRRDAAA